MKHHTLLMVSVAVLLVSARPATAQQVYVSTPMVNVNDSFYEWFGIDWGFQSRGRNGSFFFNRGSSLGTIPRFGGFDPSAAARLGFSHQGANQSFFFNLTAAQGSNRTITSSTPSVTMTNGAIGSIRDVQMRPFVTGLIPVVGSGASVSPPRLISPLKQRLARLRAEKELAATSPSTQAAVVAPAVAEPAPNDDPDALVLGPIAGQVATARASASVSTAERGDISVAEIRRRQQAQEAEEAESLQRLIEEARSAEVVGRFGAARVRYRQAAARATGALRRELLAKYESIRDR